MSMRSDGDLQELGLAEQVAEKWEPCLPPFSSYEASDGQPGGRAQIRSVDRRLENGRRCQGQLISQHKPGKYWQVTIRDDDGERRTPAVHALVVPAHEKKACPPGMQVRHYDDDPDNNAWAPGGEAAILAGGPGNLIFGTPKQNLEDRMRNSPAAPPRPVRLCERHGNPVTQGSKSRCKVCVTEMGVAGAELLGKGFSPQDAANALAYPSPEGLVNLAIKYGGYRPSHMTLLDPPPEPSRSATTGRMSRRVATTVRRWLRLGDRA